MIKYKLKQDIAYPGVFIPAGTTATKKGGLFNFSHDQKSLGYTIAEIENYTDYFENIGEPKWHDEDMLDFAFMCQCREPLDRNDVKDYFNDFINANTNE